MNWSKIVTPLVLIAAGGAIIYGLGRQQQRLADQEAILDAQTQAAVVAFDSLHAKLASATLASEHWKEVAHQQSVIAWDALLRADSLEKMVDSLPVVLDSAKTCSDSLSAYRSAMSSCQRETAQLRTAVGALVKDTVALSIDRNNWQGLAFDADSVASGLKIQLQLAQNAGKCHILFIPCPSRTLTAGIFTILGFIVGRQ